MAITATHLNDDYADAGGLPWVTKSMTFSNNKLYLAAVWSISDETNWSACSGGGITWVKVTAASAFNAGPGNWFGGALFRGLVTSGATSGALSFSGDTGGTFICSVEEFSGMDTTGTNGSGAIVQGAVNLDESGAASAISCTLSAFGDAVNNAVFAYTGVNAAGAITPDTSPAGYVELRDLANAGVDGQLQTMWNTGQDTSPATSWGGGHAALIGAVEIKAEAALARTMGGHPIPRTGVGRRAGS